MTQLGYGGDDPTNIGTVATNRVGFYGKTPVVQGANVTTVAVTTDLALTLVAGAINSIITRLRDVGLIAS